VQLVETPLPQDVCPLCGRPFGRKVEKHHIVPKSKGGRITVPLHPICHRKIHKVFTRTELTALGTIEALRDHPDIKTYVSWIRKKPADFYRRTR
jgi:5-methylcytosine-specific restriction endonuclease McrA